MKYKQGDRIIASLNGVNSRAAITKVLEQDLYIIVTGAKERRIILGSQICRSLEQTKDLALCTQKRITMNHYAKIGEDLSTIPAFALVNGESVPLHTFRWDASAQRFTVSYGGSDFMSVDAKDFNEAFVQAIRLILESK